MQITADRPKRNQWRAVTVAYGSLQKGYPFLQYGSPVYTGAYIPMERRRKADEKDGNKKR